MTEQQIKQAQAAAENLEKRIIHLSDETKKLYKAVSHVDDEACDLSYDVIHLCDMLETNNEEEKE